MSADQQFSQESFETFERYLRQQMSREEVAEFEQKLAGDPDLQQELSAVKVAIEAVEVGGMKERVHEVGKHFHDQTKPKKGKLISMKRFVMLAALFTGALAVWWWLTPTSTNDALFAEFVTIEPGAPVPMSAVGEDYTYRYFDAMVDFKEELYRDALNKWTPLLESTDDSDSVLYFIGAAYFSLGEFNRSKEFHQKVTALTAGRYNYKAEWFTVLASLKVNDLETIAEIANGVEDDSPYSERIREINKRIHAE